MFFHIYIIMKIIITEEQKKKLFIPRRLSGENSKWLEWNNHQPVKVVDGKEIKINQKNSDGLKQGYWEDHYQNTNTWHKGHYKDDKRVGYWEEEDRLAKDFLHKGFYEDGLKQGVWEEYAPNGEIFAVGPYIDNEKNGEWKVYNTKENRLDRILTFKNDRLVKKIPIY